MNVDELMYFINTPQMLSVYKTLRDKLSSKYADTQVKVSKTQISFKNRHISGFYARYVPVFYIGLTTDSHNTNDPREQCGQFCIPALCHIQFSLQPVHLLAKLHRVLRLMYSVMRAPFCLAKWFTLHRSQG